MCVRIMCYMHAPMKATGWRLGKFERAVPQQVALVHVYFVRIMVHINSTHQPGPTASFLPKETVYAQVKATEEKKRLD